jgi:hypothetical protein
MDEFYQLKEVRPSSESLVPEMLPPPPLLTRNEHSQELDDNLKGILKQILNIVEPGAADTKIVCALKHSLELLPVGKPLLHTTH